MSDPPSDPDLYPVLDLDDLGRRTFGDEALMGELLALFDRQCGPLLARVVDGRDPADRREAAHTLAGSASAVAARRVAVLAGAIEVAILAGQPPAAEALGALGQAVAEVRALIAVRAG